ncbi:hypothetical protein [Hymenobacter arizonensis]|uniref:Lipoprotein n=1 Tax=Hymenobacter arizonensis TaxID=1227077 RepID=A0A1I6AC89_HYMAR|nr:hypothetical protein [Hymenobacter arizonensis]SFQ66301.1 hypothetical protein SAMN04515668_3543 [Hymenobacter arizonensis]
MLRYLLLVLLSLSLLACSKSDSNPIVDFGEGLGITYRTAQNLPNGPNDPTDWTSDGNWNKQERGLFSDVAFDLNAPQKAPSGFETSAYPNPSPGQAAWTIWVRTNPGVVPPLYTMRAALVNRKYQVMERLGPVVTPLNTTYIFDFPKSGLSPNEHYRLYYVVSDASGLVFKGHGDVRYY